MTYELAKQLYYAGFINKRTWCGKFVGGYDAPNGQECNGQCYPTLSELIEACQHTLHGRGVFTLSSANDGELWVAHYLDYFEMKVDAEYTGQSKTPEEAVAKLWLTLHSE